jgi:Flp pilus assembly protein TadB
MPTDTSGRSISDVLRSIVDNVQDIVRSELRLAKTEIGVELAKAKGAGVLLGMGAVCGFFAVLFTLLAAVFGLGMVVPMWAAALIVAAPIGVAGVCMYSAGRKRLRRVHPVPERAVETTRESIEWAKQQIK